MRAEVIESATRAVPHVAALLAIDERRKLEFVHAEAGANRSRPVRIRIGDDAIGIINDGEAVGPDIERVLRLTLTDIGVDAVGAHDQSAVATDKIVPTQPDTLVERRRAGRAGKRSADLRTVFHERRAHETDNSRVVLRPLKSKIPREIRPANRSNVERHLVADIAELRTVLKLCAVSGAQWNRERQNHIYGVVSVVRQRKIGLLVEESEVKAGLEFLLALRFDIGVTKRP